EWVAQASGTTDNLLSIYGADAVHVWIGGELGTLLDLQSSGAWRLRNLAGAGDFYGIWVSDVNEVFLAGSDGKVYRSTDNLNFPSTTVTSGGLWGINGNNTTIGPWVISSTQIFAWKGTGWGKEYEDVNASLLGIWGSTAVGNYRRFVNPVYLYEGIVLDGPGSWTAERPTTLSLTGVWGTGSDLYVVGRGGTILRKRGTMW